MKNHQNHLCNKCIEVLSIKNPDVVFIEVLNEEKGYCENCCKKNCSLYVVRSKDALSESNEVKKDE